MQNGFSEAAAVLSTEIAARLDPNKSNGLWWFNKRRMMSRQVSEVSKNGRRYAKKYTSYIKPREEWIAVPVPDAGIPREVVDTAKVAIQNNRVPSRAGSRFWELSGGIACCGVCGRRLRTLHRTKRRKKSGMRSYGYYRCPGYHDNGKAGCDNRRMVSAPALEEKAWLFVRAVMMDPEELTRDLERMIELKREGARGDSAKDMKLWIEELAKLERMRDGYHDQAAEGLMSLERLRERIAAIEERREVAERELAAIRGRREEVEQLERDRDTVIEYYADLAPEALDSLTPEERHGLYKILKLKVMLGADKRAWAQMPIGRSGSLEADPAGYRSEVTSRCAHTDAR